MSNWKMYQLLQEHGGPVIERNGPMAGLYSQLGWMRVYQFISVPLIWLFCFIAFNERRDYGAPTNLSLGCVVLAIASIIISIVFEFRPLKAIRAMEVIKDLISQDDEWDEFLLWFKTKGRLCREVSIQMQMIQDAGEDPQCILSSQVQRAMIILTGHRISTFGSRVERNIDPVPGD